MDLTRHERSHSFEGRACKVTIPRELEALSALKLPDKKRAAVEIKLEGGTISPGNILPGAGLISRQ